MVKIGNRSKPYLHTEYLSMLGSLLLWSHLPHLSSPHWTPATLLCCCLLNTPSSLGPLPIAWVSPSWCYKLSLKFIWVSAQCHHIGQISLSCLKYQLSVVLHPLHCFLFLLSTYHHLISFLINPLSFVCFQKLQSKPHSSRDSVVH